MNKNLLLVYLGGTTLFFLKSNYTEWKARRELLLEYNELVEKHNRNIDKITYLVHILNKHHIKLDEFDLIALETVKVIPGKQGEDTA